MQQLANAALRDERIGNAEVQSGRMQAHASHLAQHALASAAGNNAFLDGNHQLRARRFANGIRIKRLHPAHVHHAHADALLFQRLCGLASVANHAAKRQKSNVVAFAHHAGLALRQHFRHFRQRHALRFPARVANGERAAHGKRRMQAMHQLSLVRGGQHAHVRHHAGVHQVEHAMVRGAVGAHDAGAIDGEHHVKLRQRHVDDHLVDGALHEHGVQRNNGFLAARGQTTGKPHGVFFGNARVHEALRELLGERIKPRAALHGCRDGHDILVRFRFFHQRGAEHVRVLRR